MVVVVITVLFKTPFLPTLLLVVGIAGATWIWLMLSTRRPQIIRAASPPWIAQAELRTELGAYFKSVGYDDLLIGVTAQRPSDGVIRAVLSVRATPWLRIPAEYLPAAFALCDAFYERAPLVVHTDMGGGVDYKNPWKNDAARTLEQIPSGKCDPNS